MPTSSELLPAAYGTPTIATAALATMVRLPAIPAIVVSLWRVAVVLTVGHAGYKGGARGE